MTNIAEELGASAPSPASDGFIPADADNISLFPDLAIDNMMHVMIALGAELWTVRRRMMVLERVLEGVGLSSDDVEKFRFSREDKKAVIEERKIFISRTFGALTRRGGANEKQQDMSGM